MATLFVTVSAEDAPTVVNPHGGEVSVKTIVVIIAGTPSVCTVTVRVIWDARMDYMEIIATRRVLLDAEIIRVIQMGHVLTIVTLVIMVLRVMATALINALTEIVSWRVTPTFLFVQ